MLIALLIGEMLVGNEPIALKFGEMCCCAKVGQKYLPLTVDDNENATHQNIGDPMSIGSDSILVSPGSWVGLHESQTVLAFRDPRFLQSTALQGRGANGFFSQGVEAAAAQSPSIISLATTVCDEFASIVALWFNLLQINHASFPTLLGRLAAKQREKIQSLKRMVAAQNWPSFVAPAGELEEERAAYTHHLAAAGLTQWLPPTPSHTHMFFCISLPPPFQPRQFNLTLAQLNSYLSNRLSQRIR
jgi:hypothetical protein